MSTESTRKEIINRLETEIVNVTFTKTDGNLRKMRATLSETIIPNEVLEAVKVKRDISSSPDVITVYDVDVQGWRSFRWDSLIFAQRSHVE